MDGNDLFMSISMDDFIIQIFMFFFQLRHCGSKITRKELLPNSYGFFPFEKHL
jgi:hypothetical protein